MKEGKFPHPLQLFDDLLLLFLEFIEDRVRSHGVFSEIQTSRLLFGGNPEPHGRVEEFEKAQRDGKSPEENRDYRQYLHGKEVDSPAKEKPVNLIPQTVLNIFILSEKAYG